MKSKKLPRRKHIHDLHCRITGPAVAELQMAFLKDWAYSTRSKLVAEELPYDFPLQKKEGDSIVRVGGQRAPGRTIRVHKMVFFTAPPPRPRKPYGY